MKRVTGDILEEGQLSPSSGGFPAEATPHAVAVRRAALVESLPRAARARLQSDLVASDAEVQAHARALLWALDLLEAESSAPVDLTEDGVWLVETTEGQPWAIAVAAFRTSSQGSGEPEDLERLRTMTSRVLGGRPHAIQVRRPLPRGADLEPVGRALQLWAHSVDRGEWEGAHATYDHGDLALDFSLLAPSGPEGLVLLQGPSGSLHRLAVVDTRLQALTRRHLSDRPALPLVTLLAASPAWGFARGYPCQLLYGTPDEVFTERGPDALTHRAIYHRPRFGLFADELFSNLASIWWAEGLADSPRRAWAHDNPWSRDGAFVPAVQGARYTRVSVTAEGTTMAWTAPEEDA